MKKRIPIAILIMIALSAAIIVPVFLSRRSHRPMPVYQGKTAEQWLGEIFTTNQTAAMTAFRQMGTNAFPVLIDALNKKDTAWSRLYGRIYRKLPVSWQQHLGRPVRTRELWSGATLVLINDRANARMMLTELVRMLEDKSLGSRYYLVPAVSSRVGPEDTQCLPALINCVEDTNDVLRLEAIDGLERIGPGATKGVPALTMALANSNVEVRVSAAWALWKINHDTNLTVPVLRRALNINEVSVMNFRQPGLSKYWALIYLHEINPGDVSLIPTFIDELQSPNNDARNTAIMLLAGYGSSAPAAVPALTNFLNSQDVELRQQAMAALKKIDPENAAKYESK